MIAFIVQIILRQIITNSGYSLKRAIQKKKTCTMTWTLIHAESNIIIMYTHKLIVIQWYSKYSHVISNGVYKFHIKQKYIPYKKYNYKVKTDATCKRDQDLSFFAFYSKSTFDRLPTYSTTAKAWCYPPLQTELIFKVSQEITGLSISQKSSNNSQTFKIKDLRIKWILHFFTDHPGLEISWSFLPKCSQLDQRNHDTHT